MTTTNDHNELGIFAQVFAENLNLCQDVVVSSQKRLKRTIHCSRYGGRGKGGKYKKKLDLSYLHGHRKVVLCLRRKEDINGFFLERGISVGWSPDLDDVELAPSCASDGEAEQGALQGVALHLELAEGGGVALDGLRDVPLDAEELHGAHHAVVLGRDPDQQQPVHDFVSAVINNLEKENWLGAAFGNCRRNNVCSCLIETALLLFCIADPESESNMNTVEKKTVCPHLTTREAGMSVEDFCWLAVPLHGPVIDRGLRHQGHHILGDPLPEDDVIRHGVRLHLRLHLDIEDLQSLLGLEGDNLAGGVHDG